MYAFVAGLTAVAAGAVVGTRLATPSPAVTVLDTVAVAVGPTMSVAPTTAAVATTTAALPSTTPSSTTSPSTVAEPTTTSSPAATTGTTVTANRDLRRGDCVDDRSGAERRVSCDEPHTREVVAVLDGAGLQREFGTTARPEPGSPQDAAVTTYCAAQVASYLPRPLAPGGRFRSVAWLIVPEAWAREPGVECAVEEYAVTTAEGFSLVARTGRLQTDLPADQSLEVPAGACLDVSLGRFAYVACPGGNALALGSVDWPVSNDASEVGAACRALLPPEQEAALGRVRSTRPSEADLAAGARRAVCVLLAG